MGSCRDVWHSRTQCGWAHEPLEVQEFKEKKGWITIITVSIIINVVGMVDWYMLVFVPTLPWRMASPWHFQWTWALIPSCVESSVSQACPWGSRLLWWSPQCSPHPPVLLWRGVESYCGVLWDYAHIRRHSVLTNWSRHQWAWTASLGSHTCVKDNYISHNALGLEDNAWFIYLALRVMQ